MSQDKHRSRSASLRRKVALEAGRILARSAVFSLLARALRYPDAEFFSALRDGGWAAELRAALRQCGIAQQDLLVAELECLPETVPTELTDLQSLHTALFSSGSVCPHQESDYAAAHVFQKADLMADVAGFYAAFGVQPSSSEREAPDFLGSELEFAYLLCRKEAYALQHGNRAAALTCRQAQTKFLAEHLGLWVGPFRQRMQASPAAGRFYILAACLIESFVLGQLTQARPARPSCGVR